MALIFVQKKILQELKDALSSSSIRPLLPLHPLLTRKGVRQLRAIETVKKSERSEYAIVSLRKWKHAINTLRRKRKQVIRDQKATVSDREGAFQTFSKRSFSSSSSSTSEESSSSSSEQSEQSPLTKTLSVHLVETYQLVYRNHQKHRKLVDDDDHGNLILSENLLLHPHYRVVTKKPIGQGTFGQVVLCEHIHSGKAVAIKIINSKPNFTRQAQTELDILTRLERNEVPHVIRLLDVFEYRGHVCFVFPLLGPSLYDFLKHTQFAGASLNLVRKIARQLFFALNSMLPCPKTRQMGIIHCDLKPENILLLNTRTPAVNIIDFGAACATNGRAHSYIQSRYYRAPEVIFRGNYTHPIDMWSMGCILMELHTGQPLFTGANESELIAAQVATLGMPPDEVLKNGRAVSRYFTTTDDGSFVLRSNDIIPGSRRLAEVLRLAQKKETKEDNEQFLDLIQKLLDWSPATRIHPADAFEHPFLKVLNPSS